MNNQMQITAVMFNEAASAFYIELPPLVCDNLLLSCDHKKGITLCHSSKLELENFREKLIGLHDGVLVNRDKSRRRMRRKVLAALFLISSVCFLVFTRDLFSGGLFYHWLFNFVLILVWFGLYKAAAKFLFVRGVDDGTSRLQQDLDLIIIHNRIRDEFTC